MRVELARPVDLSVCVEDLRDTVVVDDDAASEARARAFARIDVRPGILIVVVVVLLC